MAKVSFVVPVYNVENYLRECLDSALVQTLADIEIVCVNDGSTDGSASILDEYATKDKRIKIVTQENAGLSAARNAGLQAATGRYLLFLDSDDLISPDAAEKLFAKAEKESLDVLFYDTGCFADTPAAEPATKRYTSYYQRSRAYSEPCSGASLIASMMANSDYLCSACLEIWRKGFLEENGLAFTEGILHEDTEFTFKASLQATRAAHLHEELYHRRVRASGSIMTDGIRFASSYGVFVAFLGMEQAYANLAQQVEGCEWLLREMESVLFVARDRYGKLDPAERAKAESITDKRIRHLYQTLVAAPVDGDLRPEPVAEKTVRPTRANANGIKISVIIPVYNMGRFVAECLESVLGQTLREIEVICVDDGSTDDSPTILADFARRDNRVHVITQKNQGVFAARNNALDVACGEFVIFMDPDDWYCDLDGLRTLYAEAVANKVNVCGGEIVEMLDKNTLKPLPTGYVPSYRYRRGGFFEFSEYQYFGWYTRFIFNRQMLEENGIRFPPYTRYQDPPFMVKAMIAAGRFYAVKRVFYAVRVEHKTINWKTNGCRKLVDFLTGNADIYRMARKHGLDRLAARQRDNLTSTGMMAEVLANLNVPAVRNALAEMLRSMGTEACIDVLAAMQAQIAVARGQTPAKAAKLKQSKFAAIIERTIQCYRDEGPFYTLKRMLALGRK